MKKLLKIFLFILIVLTSVSFANAKVVKGNISIEVPKWENYCPSKFIKAKGLSEKEIIEISQRQGKENSKVFWCKSDTKLANTVRWATLIPALDCKCATKLMTSVLKNNLKRENPFNFYWENRRNEFNNKLSICNKQSYQNKNSCYESMNGKIGAQIFKEPGTNKFFITRTLKKTPASISALVAGSQLLKVDGLNISNLPLEDVTLMISGIAETDVELTLKSPDASIKNYKIKRKNIKINTAFDKTYQMHLAQFVPSEYINAEYIYPNLFSASLQLELRKNNYWANRQEVFKDGYNLCKTYAKNEQNICFMNLVNRELNKTANDRQIELQTNIAQQQAIQSSLNQLNQNIQLQNIDNSIRQNGYNNSFQLQNINNSLQQQNYQLRNINNTLRYRY